MVLELQWDRGFALEQAGDDEELLTELLGMLRQSSANDLRRMKEALQAGDGPALADAAHNTKGAAASLGMESVRLLASDLEQAGRAGELAGVATQLTTLETLLKQLPAG
ncbi:Hpt domain-containing protein [Desulfurivibrio alkaliphilus]|uniref:Hpt protein n=1 Tax=Desulfurivibrio alkaliphilus (strain DSM 19089 / UNIQEM U267 / AHT2) TaxID=589865 RepID=D6Z3B5_DESAT|nr:Hpt domain-containing protein [Desulfurivibrio alkaliphilus]ADH86040.1 Hpt protein [Desulfurivibrio alkaliphilus AHT 2]